MKLLEVHMFKNKRFVLMSLLLLIGVLLAACSKNEAETNGNPDKGEEAKNNTVGTGNIEEVNASSKVER